MPTVRARRGWRDAGVASSGGRRISNLTCTFASGMQLVLDALLDRRLALVEVGDAQGARVGLRRGSAPG